MIESLQDYISPHSVMSNRETSANLPSRAYDEAWRQDLELTCDPDVHLGSVVCARRNILHLPQRQEAIYDPAKHDVFPVQKGARLSGDEELTSVGARPRVGHAEQTGLVVLEAEVLVFESVAVDGARSGAVCVDVVSTLAHKVLDDAVEDGVLVALGCVVGSELARTQLTEVLTRPRDDVGIQLELDAACRVFADGDVHKHNGSTVGARARYTRRCRCHGDASVLGVRRNKSQAWRLGPQSAGSSDFGFRPSPPMHPLIGGELWIFVGREKQAARVPDETGRADVHPADSAKIAHQQNCLQPWTLGHWQRALASSQQTACQSATPWCLVSVSHIGGR